MTGTPLEAAAMHPDFVDAAKMLAVPKLATRTEAQVGEPTACGAAVPRLSRSAPDSAPAKEH